MNGVVLAFYYLLQWTWGIVQNIIGLLLWLFFKMKKRNFRHFGFFGAQVTVWSNSHGSMGLGMFIFDGHGDTRHGKEMLVHEYGHTWQSAALGPFFLLVVGIPSFLWAALPAFGRLRKRRNIDYMDFYTEAWASKWGSALTSLPAAAGKNLERSR